MSEHTSLSFSPAAFIQPTFVGVSSNPFRIFTSCAGIVHAAIDGVTAVVLTLFLLVAPAAAQTTPTSSGDGASSSMFLQVACDAGLGELFTFILTGAAVYVITKGIVITIIGLDKRGSKASGTKQKAGREAIKEGATQIAGGIFLPPLLLGVLTALGVSLGCLTPTLGI